MSATTYGWLVLAFPLAGTLATAVGFRRLGGAFALRSAAGIAGLAAALVFIPYPDVTPDLVLTAVFGGFFIGAGIGLAIRGGLKHLGFDTLESVRAGKYLELRMTDPDRADAERKVDGMCRQLLANPVIEEYRYELEGVSS